MFVLAPLLALLVACPVAVAVVAVELLPAQPPVHLRVEGLLEPVAVISEPLPRFSFLHAAAGAVPPAGPNVTQSSYRITVADADGGAGASLMWDSGHVASTNCSHIAYAGAPLTAFTR